MENLIEDKLMKLKKSKFRAKFHLSQTDKEYIKSKTLDVIKQHAQEFIKNRLSPKIIQNDGKQTPMRGHPVFIGQHATATCCRECLFKWHKIQKNKELSEKEIDFVVSLIMAWIENEMKDFKTNKVTIQESFFT